MSFDLSTIAQAVTSTATGTRTEILSLTDPLATADPGETTNNYGVQRDYALGTVQTAAEQVIRHALKVAKRLVQVNAQAQVSGLLAQLARAAGEADEVGLKQLNAIKPRSGNGFELLAQGSAQRDGGNGSAHGYTSCLSNQWFRKAKGRAARPPCGRQRQYLICATARSSSAVAVP